MSYYSMAHMYETVRNMYDSPRWRERVLQMSDDQIMAIFYEKLERDKRSSQAYLERFDAIARRNAERDRGRSVETGANCYGCTDEKEKFVPVQLSFFD